MASLRDIDDKYIVSTDDQHEAGLMISAQDMSWAINSYYNEVLRPYLKGHIEVSEEAYNVIDEIREKSMKHFEGFFDD